MSALTACANVTHEHFLPYLAPVMESIAEGLSLTDDTDPAQMGFRAQVRNRRYLSKLCLIAFSRLSIYAGV